MPALNYLWFYIYHFCMLLILTLTRTNKKFYGRTPTFTCIIASTAKPTLSSIITTCTFVWITQTLKNAGLEIKSFTVYTQTTTEQSIPIIYRPNYLLINILCSVSQFAFQLPICIHAFLRPQSFFLWESYSKHSL